MVETRESVKWGKRWNRSALCALCIWIIERGCMMYVQCICHTNQICLSSRILMLLPHEKFVTRLISRLCINITRSTRGKVHIFTLHHWMSGSVHLQYSSFGWEWWNRKAYLCATHIFFTTLCNFHTVTNFKTSIQIVGKSFIIFLFFYILLQQYFIYSCGCYLLLCMTNITGATKMKLRKVLVFWVPLLFFLRNFF